MFKPTLPRKQALIALVAGTLLPAPLLASVNEKEELLKLKNTTLNLIDMLVQEGILDKKKASAMIKNAEKKASDEAKTEVSKEEAASKAEVDKIKGNGKSAPVRITYVPDFVKDEIRKDVRKELKDEVVKQVKAEAKDERWGIPGALPEWVNRIKPYADIRLRFEDDFFGANNVPNAYYNWPAINARGGIANTPNPYLNTTEDRDRFRVRFRFGAETEIVEGLKANFRVTTSNDYSPTSTNQTLGNYFQGYIVQLDRAFLQYDYLDDEGHDWLTLWGGRTPNPYFSTDNLWYTDVQMEGFSGTFRFPFGQDDPELRGYNAPNTAGRLWFTNLNQGFTKPNEIYLTGGWYPLQELQLTSHDKWLGAAQTGFDWLWDKDQRIKSGIAYYYYQNTQAKQNPLGSQEYNWSAPQYFTQGNSLAVISNPLDPSLQPQLVGLASQFEILDAILQYDYTGFAPNHIMLTGNYTKNFGFNQQEIYNTLGENINPQTTAYQIRLDVGRPDLLRLGDWNAWVSYKYTERDSVMDAFNDSNFHLGGTNNKGYVIGANFGLATNVWTNVRWLSSQVITGPTYDVDVLLVDLNARY